MNLSAVVLHNVSIDTFTGFRPGTSRLFHAHEFQIVADSADQACELLWTLCNVDDANHLASVRSDLSLYGRQVAEYRRRKNRSLSIGDAVVLHELGGDSKRWVGMYAVAAVGWQQVGSYPYTDGTNQSDASEAYDALKWRH